MLLGSAAGNGEDDIGGDRALDACPSDRGDIIGDVGDEAAAIGERGAGSAGGCSDLGERGEGDAGVATTLFCESESGDGLWAGRTPETEGPAGGCGIGELVDDALDADRDLLVNASRDALCEIVLPSAVLRKRRAQEMFRYYQVYTLDTHLSPFGRTSSSCDESNPENERERGLGFLGSVGKKFARGGSFSASAPGSVGIGAVIDRILFAGMLFGGSSVKNTGIGPTELASSWSNFA